MSNPNAPQDPFEIFRRLWGPLGLPVPGMAMPTLDPAEIDKRIADLKSVEGWLAMNLNMLRLSIQGLEMQKLALQAMQAAVSGGAGVGQPNPLADLAAGTTSAAANSMLWPWAMIQQAMSEHAAAAAPADAAPGGAPPQGKGP